MLSDLLSSIKIWLFLLLTVSCLALVYFYSLHVCNLRAEHTVTFPYLSLELFPFARCACAVCTLYFNTVCLVSLMCNIITVIYTGKYLLCEFHVKAPFTRISSELCHLVYLLNSGENHVKFV